jgi:hypothetical protein
MPALLRFALHWQCSAMSGAVNGLPASLRDPEDTLRLREDSLAWRMLKDYHAGCASIQMLHLSSLMQ